MELSHKDIGGIVGWALSVGGLVTWVKIRVKDHGEIQKKHAVRLGQLEENNTRLAKLEEYAQRLAKVEGRFFTENDEPALLSYRAHNHICEGKNKIITQELQHVIAALDNHSRAVKDNSAQVAGLAIAVAVLEERLDKEHIR